MKTTDAFSKGKYPKISGPFNIDNIWRIRNNMEIDKLMEGVNIVGFIKA